MNSELINYGPIAPNHPAVGTQQCAACKQLLKAGEVITLVPIGPGDDPVERERARLNRPYNAVAVIAHWACATGEE